MGNMLLETNSLDYTHYSLLNDKRYKVNSSNFKKFYNLVSMRPNLCMAEKLKNKFVLFLEIKNLDSKLNFEDVLKISESVINKYYDMNLSNRYILVNQSNPNNYRIIYREIIVNTLTMIKLSNLLNDKLKIYYMSNFENYDSVDFNIYDMEIYHKKHIRLVNSGFPFIKGGKRVFDNKNQYILHKKYKASNFDAKSVENQYMDLSVNLRESRLVLPETTPKISLDVLILEEKSEDEEKKEIEFSNPKEMNRYNFYFNTLVKNNNHILKKLLACLHESRRKDNVQIITLAQIFKNTNLPIDVLKDFLGERRGAINYIYSINDHSISNTKQVDIKTLLKMAKEDNPEMFKNIIFPVSRYEYFDLYLNINTIKDCISRGERGLSFLTSTVLNKRLVTKAIGRNKYETYYWDGDVWKLEAALNSDITVMISDCLYYLLDIYKDSFDEEETEESNTMTKENKKDYKRCLKMLENVKKINSIRDWVYIELKNPEAIDLFDTNKDIISVKNGIIDLKTGQIRGREYDDYLTHYMNTEYFPNIDTTDIEIFFMNIMLNDEHLVDFFQRVLGYIFTGHTNEQKFFIWTGPGSNGKSVTTKLLTDLLGMKYFCTLSGQALTVKYNSGKATTAYNGLDKSRLAILDESDKNQKINEGIIKRFTGGSQIKVRELYSEEKEIDLYAKFVLATNYLPHVTDDPALHRRMVVIPFDAKFLNEHTSEKYNPKIPNHRLMISQSELYEKITKEKLLAWIVRGCVKWYEQGLENIPVRVSEKNEEYLLKSDKLKEYIKTYCEKDNTGMSLALFLRSYNEYSGEEMTLRELKEDLDRKGIETYVNKKKRYIKYIIAYDEEDI